MCIVRTQNHIPLWDCARIIQEHESALKGILQETQDCGISSIQVKQRKRTIIQIQESRSQLGFIKTQIVETRLQVGDSLLKLLTNLFIE